MPTVLPIEKIIDSIIAELEAEETTKAGLGNAAEGTEGIVSEGMGTAFLKGKKSENEAPAIGDEAAIGNETMVEDETTIGDETIAEVEATGNEATVIDPEAEVETAGNEALVIDPEGEVESAGDEALVIDPEAEVEAAGNEALVIDPEGEVESAGNEALVIDPEAEVESAGNEALVIDPEAEVEAVLDGLQGYEADDAAPEGIEQNATAETSAGLETSDAILEGIEQNAEQSAAADETAPDAGGFSEPEASDSAAEEIAAERSEQGAGQSAAQGAEGNAEQGVEQGAEQNAETAEATPGPGPSDAAEEPGALAAAEGIAAEGSEQGVGQSAAQGAEENAEQSVGQSAAQGAEENAEQGVEQNAEQNRKVAGPAHKPLKDEKFSRKHKNKKGKKRKRWVRIVHNIVSGIFATVAALIIVGVCYGGNIVYGYVKDLPQHDFEEIEASLKILSTIYDDEGNEIKDIYLADSRRELVTFEQIPKNLINAMVAVEDKTFWDHKGFNITRMIGAVREAYIGGGEIQGTSTITQQLARNIWLAETRSEYSLERKVREAYYARELEKNLTKEEIMTHYLNMVALGNHSYGVAAAARLYFDKDLSELDLLECAALAALPQSPSKNSMITTVPPGFVDPGDPAILLTTNEYVFLYNEDSLARIHLVLDLMYEQGYITKSEYTFAKNDELRNHLKPQPLQVHDNSSFFVDWLINDVAEDLVEQYPEDFPNTDVALQLIYSGGLEIYSTFSRRIQNIATEEFDDPENYPAARMSLDRAGNALGENNEIVLFNYNNMFVNRNASEDNQEAAEAGEDPDAEPSKSDMAGIGEPWFFLNSDDFEILPDGSMKIFAGEDKRLGIYHTSGDWGVEISVEFKDFYTKPPGSFYIVKGGVIHIPNEYKGMDENGNLILSKKLFTSGDNVFTVVPFEDGSVGENGAAGDYWIGPDHFTLDQPVIQPQGATVIIENDTGQVKGMIGGRGIEGAMQYNRALSPRQPGSTIKPLAVYGAALQKTAEGLPVAYPEESFGEYWTAVSVIDDKEMVYEGRIWPKNWYRGFRGPQTMRKAVEQSINVCAVRAQLAVGNQRSVDFLKALGITTVVENGPRNDLNPAALALGGMTLGIKPIEMSSAYGVFANEGVYVDPIGYTKVLYKNGEVLLDGTPKKSQVMDPGAAFIMNDILRTTVSQGISSRGAVKGVPVAGKTGTTTENLDVWFVGNTPKYTAAVWLGIDTLIEMNQGSAAAAGMYSRIMTRIYEEMALDPGEFPGAPDNVEKGFVGDISDYFIIGSKPSRLVYGDLVCLESGYLATPLCTDTERRYTRPLNSGTSIDSLSEEELAEMEAHRPVWYCPLHNPDPFGKYPVDPMPVLPGSDDGEGESLPLPDPWWIDPWWTDPGLSNPGGTTDPGTTGPGTTDPGTTGPGTTDPGTTDPTTDPGTTDPSTTDPGTTDPTDPGVTDPGGGGG